MKQSRRHAIMRSLLMAAGLLALGASAHAQRWENIYGGPLTEETARNGVQRVTEGGYVAVGGRRDPVLNLEDIYVVRTDNHGLVEWAFTYNIGLNDVATDIEEVTGGGTGTNGFIITGYTNHGNAGDTCANTTQDIFLLRISRCGAVVWRRTYGTTTTDEYGWDVIRATQGNGAANPGDFVVAGWQGNAATRDGLLLRVNQNGNPIWSIAYRGPVSNLDDYFYALDEATTTNPGEIIAAGGSTSFGPVGSLDTWMVRVNGNNGNVLFSLSYGDTATPEELRSVQELNSGTEAGDIVAVGQTTIGDCPNKEIYLLKTSSSLNPLADIRYGLCLDDEGYYVREVPAPAVDTSSNIIITGYMTLEGSWGHGGEDAFLKEFNTETLAPDGATFVYGDTANDRGWSVSRVQTNNNCFKPGFIVAGLTKTPTEAGTDPQQLYLFKTNDDKSTGCELSFTSPVRQPLFDTVRLTPLTATVATHCAPPIASAELDSMEVVCVLITDGTNNCPIPNCVGAAPSPQPDLDPDFSDRIKDPDIILRMKDGDAAYDGGTVLMEQ